MSRRKGEHPMTPEEKQIAMRPIIEKRIAGRIIYDAYNEIVPTEPLPPAKQPNKRQEMAIKRALNMLSGAKFPKCKYKDYRKAEALDREAGFTLEQIRAKEGFHTKNKHVCSECRCQHTAGYGTRGNWYWARGYDDLGEVGHYGIGPCHRHGPHYMIRPTDTSGEKYTARMLKEIEVMQQVGLAPDANGQYMAQVRNAAAVSEIRIDTKTAMRAMFELADTQVTKLRDHMSNPDAKEKMISGICDLFGLPPDMLSVDDVDKLMELVEQRPLTEMAQGKRVPMCDKTAIEIQQRLIKEVGLAAKQVFEVHEDDYTSNDEVMIMLGRFADEAETRYRAMGGEESWQQFQVNLKDVLKDMAQKQLGTGGPA